MNVTELPSLSVLLPSKDRSALLKRQVACIMPQLTDKDQVVFLDDGSSDDTWRVMTKIARRRRDCVLHNDKANGVNDAYNQCARLADCEWLTGAADDDEVQPGAYLAARTAISECPEARICFGRVQQSPLWFRAPTFVAADRMNEFWNQVGKQDTHGAAAFIRRDVWGEGYTHGKWMGDWWQAFKITVRHGCLFIPTVISNLGSNPGYSSQHGDDAKYNKALDQIREDVASEACKDIRTAIMAYHSITRFLDHRQPMIQFHPRRVNVKRN